EDVRAVVPIVLALVDLENVQRPVHGSGANAQGAQVVLVADVAHTRDTSVTDELDELPTARGNVGGEVGTGRLTEAGHERGRLEDGDFVDGGGRHVVAGIRSHPHTYGAPALGLGIVTVVALGEELGAKGLSGGDLRSARSITF